MSTITDVKCVLSQRAFDVFCEKFHIPEEVHPVLPNRSNTVHERPVGKIGLYTRFFDFDNFRLAAKFPEELLCLVRLSRHYTLDEDTYPSFVDKDGEDIDIFAFIHTIDPTKVKVVERERRENEPRLLETTVGRTVPLLPVAPDRGESELDANVDKLFDESGSGTQIEQGDSAGGGDGVGIQLVSEATGTVVEDTALVQPRRQRKRKTIVSDVGGPSHPPIKLREDHGTPSGAFVGGKSRSAVQRLLAGAVQNAEVRGDPILTLPFVTSSVSATPEREDEGHMDSVTGLNLRTIGAPQRPSILAITAATIVTSTPDPAIVVKEKISKPSLFAADCVSAGGVDPNAGIFSDLTRSDFLVIDPDTDLQKVYVPR
ncbi:hypothetical protein Tco_0452559 [Tanacetum coccineum]